MTQNGNNWGVIFDIDGTMVNNTPYHRDAWFRLCRRYDIPLDHQSYHEKIHARSNDEIVANLFGPDVDGAFILKIEQEKESLYRETFRPVMKETPGLIALLDELRKEEILCAAASNSPKANVDFVLDELGVRDYFDAAICRDMVKIGKPDPELFLMAAAGLNITPEKCLVFEDSCAGVQSGKAAGMTVVALRRDGSPPQDFSQADEILSDLADFDLERYP